MFSLFRLAAAEHELLNSKSFISGNNDKNCENNHQQQHTWVCARSIPVLFPKVFKLIEFHKTLPVKMFKMKASLYRR